jgi:hypothetical protein
VTSLFLGGLDGGVAGLVLGGTHKLALLLEGLEATMAELGGGIDELELNLLGGDTAGLNEEGLTESDDTSLDTGNGTLDHDEVVLDQTEVSEATNGVDVLLGQIEVSGTVVGVGTLAQTEQLVVGLGTVIVTVLTGTSDSVADARRMPGTDASNLAETLVSLTGQALGSPTGGNTLETVTLGDGDGVDELTLLEDGLNGDLLLKETNGVVNLLGDRATVNLDLHDVGLLLATTNKASLGVGDDTDNLAVLLDTLEIAVDGDLLLALSVVLGILGEGLSLGAVPVLVEAAENLLRQVVGPDGGKGAETARSLNVADNTDNDHRRSRDDGNSLNNLLTMDTRSGTFDLTDDVGHASLVTHKSGQVDRLLGIVLRELSDATAVGLAALAGQKAEGTVAWALKLTVRHLFFFSCLRASR